MTQTEFRVLTLVATAAGDHGGPVRAGDAGLQQAERVVPGKLARRGLLKRTTTTERGREVARFAVTAKGSRILAA